MDESIRRDWGARVKARRGFITQSRLAEIVGCDQSAISRLERGQLRRVSDDFKWRVAGALGCTPADLFPWPAVVPPFPADRAA